jgi:hypothetical protein
VAVFTTTRFPPCRNATDAAASAATTVRLSQ